MKKCKITSVLVVYTCTLFFIFCGIEGNTGTGVYFFHPPILDIDVPYIDINASDVFDISCYGKAPVSWRLPDKQDAAHVNDSRLAVFTYVNLTKVVNKYRSRLILLDTSYLDTGYYSCYYEGTTDFTFRDNVTSIYLFVNDPVNLFIERTSVIKGHIFLPFQQNRKTKIACLPTSSKSNVTLWKTESDLEGGEMVSLDSDVVFDPREGFILYYPTIYFSGLFQCRASYANHVQLINVTLIYMPDTLRDPQPFIDTSEALHPVVNGSFSLKCSVKVDPATSLFFEWSYPNKNSSRINESLSPPHTKTIRNYVYQEVTSHLTVNKVIPSDSGTYTCAVTDHSKKTGSAKVQVFVYASRQPTHVNFTTDIDLTEPVVYKAGQDVKFVIGVHAFPSMAGVSLYWLKDGEVLPSDPRYQLKMTDFSVKLEISHLSRSDAGTYTLIGKTIDTANNISIILDVKDKPILKLVGIQQIYLLGEKYVLQCHAHGYPTPVVWWRWKPCKVVTGCLPGGSDGWRDVEYGSSFPNKDNSTYMVYGERNYSAASYLYVVPRRSGHYICMASNVMGQDEALTPFIVTDAKAGFEVSVSDNYPVVGDVVSLTCKANVFTFSGVSWHRKFHDEGNTETIKMSNSSDTKIHGWSTAYSHVAVVIFDPVQQDSSGEYECIAFSDNKNASSISAFIDVRDIRIPVITKTNMKGATVPADPATLHEFFCNAQGVPEPTIIWRKDGRLFDVTNMSGVELGRRNQSLILKRVVEKDSGFYECIVVNRGGRVKANTTLKVLSSTAMYMNDGLTTTEIAVIILFVVVGIVVALLIFFLGKRIWKDKKQKKELDFLNQSCFERGYVDILNPNLPLQDQVELLPYKHQFEFPKERLRLGKTLGQGAFGRVVKAEAIGLIRGEVSTTVAVKMLKENSNAEQRRALIAELKILIHLGRHLNILNVLGAVTKNLIKGELMVIVEYCCYGNLRHFLLKHKSSYVNQLNPETGALDLDLSWSQTLVNGAKENVPVYANIMGLGMDNPTYRGNLLSYADLYHHKLPSDSGVEDSLSSQPSSPKQWCLGKPPLSFVQQTATESNSSDDEERDLHYLTTCHLLCYAFQCARGMEYLASRKLIHRDLAARNVLLARDNVVKICDFGLAKDCYKYSNYVKKTDGLLPVKWMAVESICDRVFTSKSDVWSFGILLWEIFTLGGNPYPGTDINDEFFKKLKNGYRMEQPELAPDSIYQIMMDCWQKNPALRPSFSELSEKIGSLLEGGVRKYYVELNAPYQVMNEELFNNNDYLQMNKSHDESYTIMQDLEANKASKAFQNTYSNISFVRPVSNGHMPKVSLDAGPMILLDSFSWNSEPRLVIKKKANMKRSLSFDDAVSAGYLSMESNSEHNHSRSDDDDDSVFFENNHPDKHIRYVNGDDLTYTPLLTMHEEEVL